MGFDKNDKEKRCYFKPCLLGRLMGEGDTVKTDYNNVKGSARVRRTVCIRLIFLDIFEHTRTQNFSSVLGEPEVSSGRKKAKTMNQTQY